MKPELSVAVPAHNEEKFIARCIGSVAASARHAGRTVEVVVALNRCSDWYLARNPRLVKQLFEGTNRRAADHFYYDFER